MYANSDENSWYNIAHFANTWLSWFNVACCEWCSSLPTLIVNISKSPIFHIIEKELRLCRKLEQKCKMDLFAVRIHMHFSQFCGVAFFEFGPSGKERNLKCRLNLSRSSRERSRGGSPSHDPLGPRKRITSSSRKTTSFAKGQNLKEWPKTPQFGHLELVKWFFSFCHSSILARRSERSSLSEIPFLAACSIRSFFRWFPVRRVLTIPETFWKVDIRCNPYGDRLFNCAQEIINVLMT